MTPLAQDPLREALRACRSHLAWATGFSALVNILYLAPTLYMMQVYDRVVPTGGLTTLLLLSVVTTFALATLAAMDWLRGRILLRAGLRLDRILAGQILARVIDAPSRTLRAQALREFDNVRSVLAGPGVMALMDAPWTPLYVACAFLLHPALGVLTLVGGGLLFVLAWLNERDGRARLAKANRSGNLAYAAQHDIAEQSEIVRALGMREASVGRQLEQRRLAVVEQAQAQLSGGRYSGAIKFLRLFLQSTALGLAAFLVVKGLISPGAIIAASVLLSRAVAPVEQLVGAWPLLVQARAGWSSLTQLFEKTQQAVLPRTQLPDPAGLLEAEGLTVALAEGVPPQLRGVNLTVRPGRIVGVIGPSGSGKTTLARILAGAITPQVGTLRLDGADYRSRPGDELARYVGYLPQTPTLFAGSVKENISRFRASAGGDDETIDRQVIAAAMAAGVHDMIQRLPQGYDTRLGVGGEGVSVGQAQRIALARALFGAPVLLVLDEPNASLDQEGEIALVNAITAASRRGAAIVVVAHRAGLLARVDDLLVLRDGSVRAFGAREDVLARMRQGESRAGGGEASDVVAL